MSEYDKFNSAEECFDSIIKQSNAKGFFRITMSDVTANRFMDEQFYLKKLSSKYPVAKISCNPYAYYEETQNKISHIWVYGDNICSKELLKKVLASGSILNKNQLSKIMPSYLEDGDYLDDNGIIVQGYSPRIARALLEFAKEGIIICPDAAIYYLMGDFFPSTQEAFDPSLKEHYGSLLQMESEDNLLLYSINNPNHLCVNIDYNEKKIFFSWNGQKKSQGTNTLMGKVCVGLINSKNTPITYSSIMNIAGELYKDKPYYGKSSRLIYDTKKKFNERILILTGFKQPLIIKTQKKELKFDDDIFDKMIVL